MSTVLEPNEDGFNHLLMALIKSRSIAAEGDYLDLLSPHDGLPGLEPWTGDNRTVDLILDLRDGRRQCDPYLWLNIANMIEQSPSWDLSLLVRGVRMPDVAHLLASLGTTTENKS